MARLPSARQAELLERAYGYVLERGLAGLSLRPLAAAIGSSPRVLLFLFGSKDGLVQAILARARADELAFLAGARSRQPGRARPEEDTGPEEDTAPREGTGLAEVTAVIWRWLADPGHRRLLVLWVEAYARSLSEPDGPWAGFARQTVADWLAVLADAQPAAHRDTDGGAAERTLALAVLRGALLDLLATGDTARTASAVQSHLGRPPAASSS